MSNPRRIAVLTLLKIDNEGAYSNITINHILNENELDNKDRAFICALVYGVLDRRITLDYIIAKYVRIPLKKMAPFTLNVLRTALYQLMFMDKIPQSAAVNEAVKIIKSSKENRNSGFVNAVLRNFLRDKDILPEGDGVEDISIRYSCPSWMVESFIEDYGKKNAIFLLEEGIKIPPVTVRVNNIKSDNVTVKAELYKQGIKVSDGPIENSLILKKGLDIANLELYKQGAFYAQDIASQKAISVLAPKAGERVLDMCAAPGGKSFTMACLMGNEGEIVACDIHSHRVKLIDEGAKRLGHSIIKATLSDATHFNSELGKFDCVLCDVPCSGLGVIRRKPDIKYKPKSDLGELCELQYRILCNAVKYLKPNGRILYSTCTLRREENEKLVIRFQKEYNNFCKVEEATLMPHIDGTDGFYYALLKQE